MDTVVLRMAALYCANFVAVGAASVMATLVLEKLPAVFTAGFISQCQNSSFMCVLAATPGPSYRT